MGMMMPPQQPMDPAMMGQPQPPLEEQVKQKLLQLMLQYADDYQTLGAQVQSQAINVLATAYKSLTEQAEQDPMLQHQLEQQKMQFEFQMEEKRFQLETIKMRHQLEMEEKKAQLQVQQQAQKMDIEAAKGEQQLQQQNLSFQQQTRQQEEKHQQNIVHADKKAEQQAQQKDKPKSN